MAVPGSGSLALGRAGNDLLQGSSGAGTFYGEAWQKANANMLGFPKRLRAQARDLSWTTVTLFEVHSQLDSNFRTSAEY